MPDIKTRHSTTNIKAGGKSRVKQVKKRKTGPSQAADKFYYDESFGQFFRRGWLGLCCQQADFLQIRPKRAHMRKNGMKRVIMGCNNFWSGRGRLFANLAQASAYVQKWQSASQWLAIVSGEQCSRLSKHCELKYPKKGLEDLTTFFMST